MPRSGTATASVATELGVEVTGSGQVLGMVVRGTIQARTAPVLSAVFDGIYRRHPVQVNLDLRAVRHVDRPGLRTLLAARRRLAAQGAELAVRGGPGVADCGEFAADGLGDLLAHYRAVLERPARWLPV